MKDLKRLEEIWASYVYEGRLDSSVQPAVAECWKKCREAGVDPNGGLGRRVDEAVFRSIREANARSWRPRCRSCRACSTSSAGRAFSWS